MFFISKNVLNGINLSQCLWKTKFRPRFTPMKFSKISLSDYYFHNKYDYGRCLRPTGDFRHSKFNPVGIQFLFPIALYFCLPIFQTQDVLYKTTLPFDFSEDIKNNVTPSAPRGEIRPSYFFEFQD